MWPCFLVTLASQVVLGTIDRVRDSQYRISPSAWALQSSDLVPRLILGCLMRAYPQKWVCLTSCVVYCAFGRTWSSLLTACDQNACGTTCDGPMELLICGCLPLGVLERLCESLLLEAGVGCRKNYFLSQLT